MKLTTKRKQALSDHEEEAGYIAMKPGFKEVRNVAAGLLRFCAATRTHTTADGRRTPDSHSLGIAVITDAKI